MCGSASSDCIIFKRVRCSQLENVAIRRVERNGVCEIVSVYKFMKTESEVGITNPLSKVQEWLKQHVLAEELYVGY